LTTIDLDAVVGAAKGWRSRLARLDAGAEHEPRETAL